MIAALVIAQWGVGACFVAHVLGMAFFIFQVFRMNVTVPARKQAAGNIWNDVAAGLAYVRGHPGIFPLFMLMTVSSLAARPLQDCLPGFAGGVFGAGANGLAVLTAGMGMGAMIGATWIALRGHTRGLVRIVVVCMVGLGLAQLGFVSTSGLWLAFGWAALSGLTLTVMATGIAALVQLAVNDSMRGRVMSLLAMIYRGVPAIGALAMGFAAEGIGLRSTFALAALGCIAAWLWMARGSAAIDTAMQESTRKRGE
jgi:hypothetical protein